MTDNDTGESASEAHTDASHARNWESYANVTHAATNAQNLPGPSARGGSSLNLRRYINIVEALGAIKVTVRVERYSGGETAIEELPTMFVFDFDSTMDREAITHAVRAEIRQATGYEPSEFRWNKIAA